MVNLSLSGANATDGWGNSDTLINIERAFGTFSGAGSMVGNAFDNQFRGFGGNDTMVCGDGFDDLRPGLGVDLVNGMVGSQPDQSHDDRDRVTYNDINPDSNGLGVIVNLSSSSVTFEGFTVAGLAARDTGGAIDTLVDIERARGTSGQDYFVGSATANRREERYEGNDGVTRHDKLTP